MKLKLILAACSIFFIGFAQQAFAQSPEQWALCTTCSSKSSFESAAIIWYGSRTWPVTVEVGNPETGVLYQISLQYDTRPLGSGSGGTSKAAGTVPDEPLVESRIVELPDGGRLISGVDDETDFVPTQSGYPHVTLSFRDTLNEPVFVDYISAAKAGAFYSADPDNSNDVLGLSSFAQQGTALVCRMAFDAQSAENPAWVVGEVRGNLAQLIKGSLGRGPYTTIRFLNGDIASYEVHTAGVSGCKYIKGTAKDDDDQLIPDDGWTSVPYGGGGRMTISMGGGGDIPAGTYYRDSYKSCAQQGTIFLGCQYYSQ